MIQYNGITLLRDENGTPLQVNIDLRVHGTELDAFMRAHGLASLEQSEMARSVTGGRHLFNLWSERKSAIACALSAGSEKTDTDRNRPAVRKSAYPTGGCDQERVSGLAAASYSPCPDPRAAGKGGNPKGFRTVLRKRYLLDPVQDAIRAAYHLVHLLYDP